LAVEHRAEGVELQTAAGLDDLAQAALGPLGPRFHPGDGDPDAGGGFPLGEPAQLDEFEGLALFRGEAGHEREKTGGEFRSEPSLFDGFHLRGERGRGREFVEGDRAVPLDPHGPGPSAVGNSVADDAVHPGIDDDIVPERVEVSMDAEEHLLE
jgi:hypothetical protein